MTRFILALGALALTSSMPVAPAFAEPPNPPNLGILDFCRVDVPANHPNLTFGSCVGSRTTANHTFYGWVPHACAFMESEQPDDFYAVYSTHSECVIDRMDALLD